MIVQARLIQIPDCQCFPALFFDIIRPVQPCSCINGKKSACWVVQGCCSERSSDIFLLSAIIPSSPSLLHHQNSLLHNPHTSQWHLLSDSVHRPYGHPLLLQLSMLEPLLSMVSVATRPQRHRYVALVNILHLSSI